MNIDDSKLIRECIEIGSVYEALHNKLISINDILQYLLKFPVNNRTMIAFKSVCNFNRLQIMDDDEPFILKTNVDEYIAIYMLYFGQKYLYGRTETESLNIARKTTSLLIKISSNNEWLYKIQLLCDICHTKLQPNLIDYELIVGGRCVNYIQYLLPSKQNIFINYFIENDYIDMLKCFDYSRCEDHIIIRCNYLKENASIYWNKIGFKIYFDFISSNIDLKSPKITKLKLDKYINLFPNLFSSEILNMSPLIYNLKLLPLYIQAYVLGFPIHIYMPSRNIVDVSINILKDKGIDEYCKIISTKNQIYLQSQNDYIIPIENKQIENGNNEDALYEEPSQYNLFDVIKIYNDTHRYFFTRSEFQTLLSKRKNTWTNTDLPYSVLESINSRRVIANKYNLPKCCILSDLLKQVEDNKLSIKTEAPNKQLSELSTRNLFTDILLNYTYPSFISGHIVPPLVPSFIDENNEYDNDITDEEDDN